MAGSLNAQNKRLSPVRSSNLELYRIISMLLIVAHHYVVNSGLTAQDGPIYSNLYNIKSLFLLLMGAWGKTGINCFVFITGYFMCRSSISLKKYLKMHGQIVLYRVGIYFIFIATGLARLTVKGIVTRILPFTVLGSGFTPCFVAFWLLIPFLNILIQALNQKQHLCLMGLLLCYYTVLPTLNAWLGSSVTMNYVSWFCVLYVISSYIRMYPNKVLDNTGLWGWLSLGSLLLSVASIVYCAWFTEKLSAYYFVSDSNKVLAVAVAFCSFNFFRTLNVPYSKVINAFGASTFGVLLIHAHSDTMRQWLWKDMLDNIGAYSLGKLLPVHAVCSVLGVFLVCSCIDMLRIRFIEKPMFVLYDRLMEKYQSKSVKSS